MNPMSKFLKEVRVKTTGTASYVAGGFPVTVNDLTVVEDVAVLQISNGYIGEASTSSGNIVTVKVYSAPNTEVTAGTDLSSSTIKLIAWGV